jgi:hypothetical protein
MKLCIWWATLVLAALVAGCDYDEYEIELTPRGNRIERKLSAWHVSHGDKEQEEAKTRLSDEKLAALDGLYEKRLTKPEESVQTFIATFSSRMPTDVGGAGYYLRYDSSLGYACVYSERFRGNDDLFSAVERVESAADKLTDITIGWFESEMGHDHRFARLKEFIDQQFRRDLKNAGLYRWTLSIAEKPDDELLVRLGHYFAEREYFPRRRSPSSCARSSPPGRMRRKDRAPRPIPRRWRGCGDSSPTAWASRPVSRFQNPWRSSPMRRRLWNHSRATFAPRKNSSRPWPNGGSKSKPRRMTSGTRNRHPQSR